MVNKKKEVAPSCEPDVGDHDCDWRECDYDPDAPIVDDPFSQPSDTRNIGHEREKPRRR